MRPVLYSRKHYVQVSLATIVAGANLNTIIAKSVDPAVLDAANEVAVGSTIKAVYIEMWVRSPETSPGTSLLSFYKASANQVMSFAEQIALHDYVQKNLVFYHTQGLTNDTDADAIPFIRQWFKIPKGKQRMAQGDTLNLAIAAQALDNVICGFMTYKEYF